MYKGEKSVRCFRCLEWFGPKRQLSRPPSRSGGSTNPVLEVRAEKAEVNALANATKLMHIN